MSSADKKYTVPVLQHVIDDKFSLIKNGKIIKQVFLLVCFFIQSGQKCSS